jgi:hypothetical protein
MLSGPRMRCPFSLCGPSVVTNDGGSFPSPRGGGSPLSRRDDGAAAGLLPAEAAP